MLSKFQIITVTHHNLEIGEIGKFSLPGEKEALAQNLRNLKEKFEIEELCYLFTCNRVSFLIYKDEAFNAESIKAFFKFINPELEVEKSDKFINVFQGEDAIMHYYEVASSIDSLVVGEREIFRQIRNAYDFCNTHSLTGDHLRLLDKNIVVTAKEVYAKTKIGEKPLSIVSLALQKLRQCNLSKEAKILLVGAGETNTLVGKFLKKAEYKNIVIFNRSLNNATDLSEMLTAPAYHLSELATYVEGFDVLIVCTNSNDTIIKKDIFFNLCHDSNEEKILVDLAVPRNVDQEVIDLKQVKYIDVEQLRTLAEENLEFRKSEVFQARKILEKNLIGFKKQYQHRQIEIALKEVPTSIKSIKEKALNSVFKDQLDELDENSKELVLEMMNYMEKKCISIPMKAAKSIIQK